MINSNETLTGLLNTSSIEGSVVDSGSMTINIENMRGPQGIQGPKGDTGPKGDQGIQGPKGDTGPKGDQGIQGPKGDTGGSGPLGGLRNQLLAKNSDLDYDYKWVSTTQETLDYNNILNKPILNLYGTIELPIEIGNLNDGLYKTSGNTDLDEISTYGDKLVLVTEVKNIFKRIHILSGYTIYWVLYTFDNNKWVFNTNGFYVGGNDVLTKHNNIQYIPTNDYNPATKKYVDDNVCKKVYIPYNLVNYTNTTTEATVINDFGSISNLENKIALIGQGYNAYSFDEFIYNGYFTRTKINYIYTNVYGGGDESRIVLDLMFPINGDLINLKKVTLTLIYNIDGPTPSYQSLSIVSSTIR